MWIARGHQRPHANVTPSSFVEPNVPFRMCHEMSASQFPVVGSASKLHGHPHAQLQLWMYSASKFHFVGIDRTSYGPGLVIGPRLLNRARRPPVPPIPHVHIATSPTDRGMVETAPAERAGLLRHLTIPVAAAVAPAVGAARDAPGAPPRGLMGALGPPPLPAPDPFPLFVLPVALM